MVIVVGVEIHLLTFAQTVLVTSLPDDTRHAGNSLDSRGNGEIHQIRRRHPGLIPKSLREGDPSGMLPQFHFPGYIFFFFWFDVFFPVLSSISIFIYCRCQFSIFLRLPLSKFSNQPPPMLENFARILAVTIAFSHALLSLITTT